MRVWPAHVARRQRPAAPPRSPPPLVATRTANRSAMRSFAQLKSCRAPIRCTGAEDGRCRCCCWDCCCCWGWGCWRAASLARCCPRRAMTSSAAVGPRPAAAAGPPPGVGARARGVPAVLDTGSAWPVTTAAAGLAVGERARGGDETDAPRSNAVGDCRPPPPPPARFQPGAGRTAPADAGRAAEPRTPRPMAAAAAAGVGAGAGAGAEGCCRRWPRRIAGPCGDDRRRIASLCAKVSISSAACANASL